MQTFPLDFNKKTLDDAVLKWKEQHESEQDKLLANFRQQLYDSFTARISNIKNDYRANAKWCMDFTMPDVLDDSNRLKILKELHDRFEEVQYTNHKYDFLGSDCWKTIKGDSISYLSNLDSTGKMNSSDIISKINKYRIVLVRDTRV